MAKDGNDRVIARLPTAEELALAEFSKSEMLQSIDKITEFSKTMITLVSGFFVAYFALLKFLGLGENIQLSTLLDPYTAGMPPVLFILGIIAFVVSYVPHIRRRETLSDLLAMQRYRNRALIIKTIPTLFGAGFFVSGLVIALYICIQLLF